MISFILTSLLSLTRSLCESSSKVELRISDLLPIFYHGFNIDLNFAFLVSKFRSHFVWFSRSTIWFRLVHFNFVSFWFSILWFWNRLHFVKFSSFCSHFTDLWRNLIWIKVYFVMFVWISGWILRINGLVYWISWILRFVIEFDENWIV